MMTDHRALFVAMWALLLLAACGGSGEDTCASEITGTWEGVTQPDEIRLGRDESFAYSGADGCVSEGSYACPPESATSGTVRVSVDSATGGLCLPAGDYVCDFAINGNMMGYDCTGGVLVYRR